MEMIFRESFTMHPYLRAMNREERRNARIKNEEKRLKTELSCDISEEILPIVKRVKAHLNQRIQKKTKARCVMLLRKDQNEVNPVRKKRHNWIRTEKLCFA